MKRIITIFLVALIPMMAMSQGNITRPGKKPQKVTTHQNKRDGKNKGKLMQNNTNQTGYKPNPITV